MTLMFEERMLTPSIFQRIRKKKERVFHKTFFITRKERKSVGPRDKRRQAEETDILIRNFAKFREV